MKSIALVFILGLLALALILPASAAGQGGNGKMFEAGSGTGIGPHYGDCPNPDCPQHDCVYNQTPPLDGTGSQYGRTVNGTS